jgi:hypothetical protein
MARISGAYLASALVAIERQSRAQFLAPESAIDGLP